MRQTDVAIVGGGLAGSTAAAMLGRAGIDAILIDPHTVYPPDLRCEKLDRTQVRVLNQTGLGEAVRRASTQTDQVWIARQEGRHIEKRPLDQYYFLYDTLVNTIRGEIPPTTTFLAGKVAAVATSPDRQRLTLADGEEISARLIVMAIGLNAGLRHTLGMTREVVSPNHSITIGFDLKPVGRSRFAFPALTYYPARVEQHVAYLSLFPIGDTMHANFFVYRDMRDPWLKTMRHAPVEALHEALPGLADLIGPFEVIGDVKIRPVDLSVTTGHRQAGVVLVGDAFGTSCPAAGTGAGKAMTDVERLCHVHIPAWLASAGMGVEKIAAFYDDPVKQASDAASTANAYYVRSIATDASLRWHARRWANAVARQIGIGALRNLRERMVASAHTPVGGNI
jgi:2-polyprenyl-6-methoxyphenol hydroxylase-like FAD-dependent oxidoreductase